MTKHWCQWCEDHPINRVSETTSAITYCRLMTSERRKYALVYMSDIGLMHMHEIVLTTEDQLTILAAFKRRFRRFKIRKA